LPASPPFSIFVSFSEASNSLHSIPSPHSRAHAHAFSSALLFAQDYGILAASAQDRPFVPVSTVVLEGAPRDLKAVFRRWSNPSSAEGSGDGSSSAEAKKKSGGLKRGGSLRTVGLAAALAAVVVFCILRVVVTVVWAFLEH
jgi:hypothetical protein